MRLGGICGGPGIAIPIYCSAKKPIKVNINIQSSLSDRTAHTPTRVYIFQFHLIPFTRTHVSHYSGWAGGVRGDTKIAFVNIYIHSFEGKSTRHTTNYNVKDLNYAQLVVVFGLNIYFSGKTTMGFDFCTASASICQCEETAHSDTHQYSLWL